MRASTCKERNVEQETTEMILPKDVSHLDLT